MSGATFPTIDPSTGTAWAQLPDAGPSDVDRAVHAARDAFCDGPWPDLTPAARGELLLRLADAFEARADALARTESRDNGKILRETRAQMHALPRWLRFFAGLADKVAGEVPSSGFPSVLNLVVREPLGVVAAIVPWNSSLMLTTWKLAPALAAGNTLVVKPSEFASASLLEAADVFAEAGLPHGVVNIVTGSGVATGEALVAHPGVDHISFTGGPQTATAIAHAAAERLTPLTLELGGKSAQVVFADADMESTVPGVLAGIFAATGQTCVAGSRLLVERPVHDELVQRLAARAAAIQLGPPQDPETQMGPVTTPGQLARVLGFIAEAVDEGATIATGGRRSQRPDLADGLFIEPTILTDVRPAMRVARDEVFGPVLSVIPFDDEDEAIAIANGTPYALAAGVWTSDVKRAHRVSRRLNAGTVWVNMYRTASPAVPVGGSGLSGYGRENGVQAIESMTRLKSVWLELGDHVPDPFVQRY